MALSARPPTPSSSWHKGQGGWAYCSTCISIPTLPLKNLYPEWVRRPTPCIGELCFPVRLSASTFQWHYAHCSPHCQEDIATLLRKGAIITIPQLEAQKGLFFSPNISCMSWLQLFRVGLHQWLYPQVVIGELTVFHFGMNDASLSKNEKASLHLLN